MFEESRMITEGKLAVRRPMILVSVAACFVIFIISSFVTAAIQMAAIIAPAIPEAARQGDMSILLDLAGSDMALLLSLFATVFMILLTILYCRLIEKRSFRSMGFSRNGIVKFYMSGCCIGLLLFALAMLIAVLSGGMQYQGMNSGFDPLMFVLFLLGFVIQGASEEVLMRSFLMVSLAGRASVKAAVLINALFFAVLHLANLGSEGIGLISVLNIFLIGILFSVYTLKYDNIWLACGLHSAWNFVQGNVFGGLVSGINIQSGLLVFEPVDGRAVVHGSSFGMEGGIAVTAVIVMALGMVLLQQKKRLKAHSL